MEAEEINQLSLDTRLVERVASLLERVLPWVAWVVRRLRWLTILGAIAAIGLIWTTVNAADPDSAVAWIALLVLAAILLAPAAVLLLFGLFLGQLLAMPDQLRAMPGTAREQGARLATSLANLRQRKARRPGRLARGAWNLRGAFLELSGLLEPFLSLAGLVRLPFIFLVIVAILAVGLELAVLLVALLVVAVT